jgi:hypothetical protein
MASNEQAWVPVRDYILEQGLCLPETAKDVAELVSLMVPLGDYQQYEDAMMAFMSADGVEQQQAQAKQMWDW